MTNYIPHYTKKQQILGDREDDLRRLIARGETEDRLLQSAEEVRLARIRALRARQAKISPADVPQLRQEIARLEAKIAAVTAMSASEVLVEFTSSK